MSVLITLFEDVLFAHCCHCVGESCSCFLLPVPSAFWKCWHKLFWEGPKIKKARKRRKRPPEEAFSLILLLHLGSGLQSVRGKISSSWLQERCFKAKQSCWAVCQGCLGAAYQVLCEGWIRGSSSFAGYPHKMA